MTAALMVHHSRALPALIAAAGDRAGMRFLKESDILPLLNDTSFMSTPQFTDALAGSKAAVQETGLPVNTRTHANRDAALFFLESLDSSQNLNYLIRRLDESFRDRLEISKIEVPPGVLTVGVFPLGSFNAGAVPRDSGVLLLIDHAAIQFLKLFVNLSEGSQP